MNDAPSPTSLERAEKLQGMGCKRKRVEDVRFTQGRGNYVDDIKLPGMLHGDFHRSSHAHARIVKIDTSKAKAVPGVVAVLTAEDLKGVNLAWMPTLAGDVQMVLADGKVLFQNQEIAFVVATDRYIAADAADLVEVEYEALPVLVDPFKAMDEDAPILREDIKDKKDGAHGPRNHHNHIFNWQVGDRELTDVAFAKAEVSTKDLLSYQRVHPCPLETCQCLASFNKITGDLTIYGTFQAPHVVRTVVALISSIPEQKIHVIAPDIGGGFGNKVGVYSGYVCADGRLDRDGTSGQMGRGPDRKPLHHLVRPRLSHDDRDRGDARRAGSQVYACTSSPTTARSTPAPIRRNGPRASPTSSPAPTISRSRTFRSMASTPTRRPAASPIAARSASPKPPMRSNARWTSWRRSSGMDPVDFRIKNFIKREQFPYNSALGWEYDSGDYHTAMQKALDATDYRKLREEQKAKQEAFKRGETREIMGIGVAFFTEIVGAGPSKNCDILGIAMFDSCEIRIHPTGKGIARMGTKSQGQGHETTWAQIIATEIGIPADDIMVEEGNTDTAPYGLGTYGSRSTPVAGAAIAMAARKVKAKAQMIAAYMLEVHEGDLEWDVDRFSVKGNPGAFRTMSQIAWAAYNKIPPGMEPGLEAVSYYDPPNMTYPFGAYICVMDIDVDTGVHKVRRFYALDDCGTRINPMIIEGQVHGGCTEGFAIAMGQEITYDEDGNVKGASLMDFFLPTAVETPHWETDYTVTPSPHHPIGAKGVGESPNVGSVPCFANAVNDAFKFAGSTHIAMPHDAYRIWQAAEDLGLHA